MHAKTNIFTSNLGFNIYTGKSRNSEINYNENHIKLSACNKQVYKMKLKFKRLEKNL